MRRRLLATTGLVGVLVVSLLTGTVGQAPVQAAEIKPGKPPAVQTSPDVDGRDLPVSARKPAVSAGMAGSKLPPAAIWPDAKSAARVPAGLAARFLSRAETKRLGVPGVVLGVKPTVAPEGRALTAAGKTRVEIDYSGFARAVGGDWASRLRLVTLNCQTNGECVEDVPLGGLKNDLATKKISGELVLPKATTTSAAPSETFVAVMAAASGSEGSYEATSLAPTSSWQVSTQTGDFSWSYPMRVPPLTFGSAPDLSISYSSGSVDGQAAATNNQASWVGLGHTLEPGYIERRYSACADDMEPLKAGAAEPNNSNHKTSDLCWNSNNATLVLGGRSTELIYIASSNTYKLKNDDGSKLENLSDAPNNARGGEHWRLTTTEGTQYYFGLNPIGYGDARANSVSTVPVFGNHPGEPCYVQGNFGASYLCSGDTRFSAWRWNVDYVVDTDKNTTTYRYVQEENTYGRNKNTGVSQYQRGSYLSLIEYGERFGANSVAPPARVRFDVDERCIPSGTFACNPEQLTADNASRWPDVPFDQICTSTTTCPNRTSPSFFTRKRLASINTEVWSGTAMRAVDTWTLAQQMYDSGGGSIALWLDGITHQGRVGGTATLPMVKLTPVAMPNRAKGFDALGGPMNRPRIKRIHSESGSVTEVTYSAADCGQDDVPANESANTRRCYPVFWVPPNMVERKMDWFNKYVVTQVIEDDLVADSTSRTTSYEYVGSPAWHYSEDELLLPKYRTWSEFRGYSYVNVRSGGSGWQTQARSLYMRGMHGDRIKGQCHVA